MGEQNYITNSKIEFIEVILKHIQRVLQHSGKEFKQNKKVIRGSINESDTIILEENDAVIYVQLVEQLAYVLHPYFDKRALKCYNENIELLQYNEYDYKINRKEEIREYFNKIASENDRIPLGDVKKILITKQLLNSKKLFVELNALLRRVDYLKGVSYSEGNDIEELEVEE